MLVLRRADRRVRAGVGSRLVLVVLGLWIATLSACGSCGENHDSPGNAPPEARTSRPFHLTWDGGRRLHLRLHRDGAADDAGDLTHD
jgi:hypothetical protein